MAHSLSYPMLKKKQDGDGENDDEEECQICMDKPKEVVLPCAHSYCMSCYKLWSSETPTCPTCRTEIKCLQGEELWHLTFNESIDMKSYINDLVSQIFELIEKVSYTVSEMKEKIRTSTNSSSSSHGIQYNEEQLFTSVDSDYIVALCLEAKMIIEE